MPDEIKDAPDSSQTPDQTQPQAETAPPEAALEEASPADRNKVTVTDAGTLRKKVSIEVPKDRIEEKFNEMFGELGKNALVPGFRVGHAPRRLIEKRFGKDVAEDVRNALVGEALQGAMTKLGFTPIGEPDLKLEDIKLPEDADLAFSFEIEAAPDFTLPDYKGIEIKRPLLEITDERVGKMVDSYRQQFGKLKPVDEPAAAGDVVVTDVQLAGEGIEYRQPNSELRVAPAQIEGILLEDLGKALEGARAGEVRSLKTKVPAAHPTEAWREKDVTATFTLREVKRMELPVADDAFARSCGFTDLAEMRETIRGSLKGRVANEQATAMRDQAAAHLLKSTTLEVPDGLATRHAAQTLRRRVMDLMMRGIPREQIEQNFQELEAQSVSQSAIDLKLSFILGKIADTEKLTVEEGEINSRIADIARQQNRRPERLRHEMMSEGTFEQFVDSLREQKALDKVLESAKVVDVTEEDQKKLAEEGRAKALAEKKAQKARKKDADEAPAEKKPRKKTKKAGEKDGGDAPAEST